MIRAKSIIQSEAEPADTITLSSEDRHKRRIAMTGDNGLSFLLDLPNAAQLNHGDDLLLEDGRHVRVLAAKEKLMKITGKDFHHLLKTAWHIGNRHLPCEINEDNLILRYDHVIEVMLKNIGASIEITEGSFSPESGAYGELGTRDHGH